jgi:hypothetical protein
LDFVIEHPTVDYLAAFLLVGSHYVTWSIIGHGDVIGWIQPGNRHDLYGFGGAIIAIIFGFSATAISHYATAAGGRANQIKRRVGSSLRRQWMGTLFTPGLASAACLLAMALDLGGTGSPVARWIFELALALALLKFIRTMFLFQAMLDVTDLDRADHPRRPVPQEIAAFRN